MFPCFKDIQLGSQLDPNDDFQKQINKNMNQMKSQNIDVAEMRKNPIMNLLETTSTKQ